MARFKAIDDARQRAKRPESIEWLAEADRVAPDAPVEEREVAHALVERLAQKYPRTFSWFVRREVHAEDFAAIAQSAQLSPGYVRHEVSDIRRSARQMARAMGVSVAVLFVIVMGVRLWQVYGDRGDVVGQAPPPNLPRTVAPKAGALRVRARAECNAGAWQRCADDLDEANALDPAGETSALRELRETARKHLTTPPAPLSPGKEKPPQ
jgi:hypothetical protein